MELNHHTNTIFALHKVYLFLGYIPITLKIGSDLREKLFEYRIIHGYPYKKVADKIGIDKSTLSNFEKGRGNKKDTIQKIKAYLGIIF
jgi:DNA-binding XRE family transcriptional regulator